MSVTSYIFDNSRALVTLLQNLERLKHSFMVCDLFEVSAKGGYVHDFQSSDAKLSAFLGSECRLWPGVVHPLISPCAHNMERLT
jgi:hypothetical protein